MTTFLISLIPACLLIHGIHILFQEGHLLERPGIWITNRLGDKWSKPIINCPICQSSFWGAICFFAIDYVFGVHLPIRQLIPYLMCLCGLNVIISKLTAKERIIVEE